MHAASHGVEQQQRAGEGTGVQQDPVRVVLVQSENGPHGEASQGAQGAGVADEVPGGLRSHPESLVQGQDEITVVQHDSHPHQQAHEKYVP